MAVLNLAFTAIDDFNGLNSLDNKENLPPSVWFACSNVVVSASGSAVALRSPYTITKTVGSSGLIKSIFNAIWSGTQIVLMDVLGAGTTTVTTYRFNTQFGVPVTPTSTRTGQADARIDRINMNNKVYEVNGVEAFQLNQSTFTTYAIGIDKPAAAPTVSLVAGGTLVLNSGVTASYAYRNSATTHVGLCSGFSATSGPTSGTSNTLRIAVVAATTTGVDGIVLFLSKDGESNRYLVVDSNGDMITYANTTANIDISASYFVDTNTPETSYNSLPLQTGTQVTAWQDRLWITGFGAGTLGPTLIYSGYEAVYAGVPQEAFPPLNVVNIPAKSEVSQVAIPTPVGLLIFSDFNAYLLTGEPQDNTLAPENTLAVTQHLDSLNWNIGTKSPNTVVSTPYGIMWLDDNKRIQLWPFQGLPKEIGLPLRNELAAIQGSAGNLALCEAVWYHGSNAQYYILTARIGSPAASSTVANNRMFIIGFYSDPKTGQMMSACATSDIAASCIAIATNTQIIATDMVLIGGTTDVVQQIFDFTQKGSGFGAGTTISFKCMAGNNEGNYSYLHSMRFDASAPDVQVRISDSDGNNVQAIMLTREGPTTYKGFVGRYGIRQQLEFVFPTDDSLYREVINLRLAYSRKQRVL
jgi:hypothetical protein